MHSVSEAENWIHQGADVNSILCNRKTPLHFAVKERQGDIVRLLISKRANIAAQDQSGQTPLNLARSLGYQEIVESCFLPLRMLSIR